MTELTVIKTVQFAFRKSSSEKKQMILLYVNCHMYNVSKKMLILSRVVVVI